MLNRNKAIEDLTDAMNILENSIVAYHKGNQAFYKVIATQLKMLLCDSWKARDISLLPKLTTSPIRLHRLCGYVRKSELEGLTESERRYNEIMDKASFRMTATVYVGSEGTEVKALFDETKPAIELNEWLEQKVWTNEVTIKRLIKSVADKASNHSDSDYNDVLRIGRSMQFPQHNMLSLYIVSIGEYILKILKLSLTRAS